MPDNFAETNDGLLLVANGIDRMLRWDGVSGQATPAGIDPPEEAVTVGGAGTGRIAGTYVAYVRFVDADGNVSDLSPASSVDGEELFAAQGNLLQLPTTTQAGVAILGAEYMAALASLGQLTSELALSLGSLLDSPVQIRTQDNPHGLVSGQYVKLERVSAAVDGVLWEIIVDGPNTFRLKNSNGVGSFTYDGGGVWKAGYASVQYTDVPVPTSPRVTRRQVLRNTEGQLTTFYVDVDSDDLAATSFTSSRDDEELAAQEEVPLLDDDGSALANRHGVPPDWKSALASHLGRVYAAVDVVYREGSAVVEAGSLSVSGVGTEWTEEMAGRFLYVVGGGRYQIDEVDEAAQTLTLLTPYLGATDPYARYAIRPAPAEADLVYYSEANLPESWPATNAISVTNDGDELTALANSSSFLYFVKKRHIYKLTVQEDPAVDGRVYLAVDGRGCLNQRCWAEVEGRLFMLDEQGVHVFDGSSQTEPVSTAIQDLFRDRDGGYSINWRGAEFFHCVHFPQQEVIRWFVSLGGSYLPRHALAFNHRLGRWWVEEYASPVGASCKSFLNGQPCVFLGCDARRVFKLWEGTLDGPDAGAGTVRGTATAATLLSLTDASAEFPSAGVVGAPLQIVDGAGRGQCRRVVEADGTTLRVDRPWLVMPDETSVYQLGGVRWLYRSGWYRFADDENQNPRRVELIFNPVRSPALADLRLYRDFSGDPIVWKTAYTSADANGFRSEDGSAYLAGDLTKTTGYLMKRFTAHKELLADAARFWSLELSGVQNAEQVVISEVTLQGVKG